MGTPTGPGGYPGETQQQPGGQFAGDPGYAGAQAGAGQGGYQQPGYQQQPAQSGPGMGERVAHAGDAVARHVKTPETKEFFKTSEFIVWGLTVLGILIAAAAVTEGNGHDFAASRAWLYVAIVSAAYIVSRGVAKAGTRRGYGDAPFDGGSGGGTPFQRGGGF
jgi:hypothetical protein